MKMISLNMTLLTNLSLIFFGAAEYTIYMFFNNHFHTNNIINKKYT